MLAKSRLYFWIGLDFYNNYLNELTFNQEEELISESLLNKLLFIYNRATSNNLNDITDNIHLDSEKLLANRSVRFQIEGFESEEWKEEYIQGIEMSLNRKKEKHFETGEESSDELYGENGSEDFDTNSEDSAENFKEMLMHENKFTKQYWLPQEPSMYVLAVGNTRVDYDFEQAIDRATGGAVSLIRSKPERMVSEELGLKEIRNFS